MTASVQERSREFAALESLGMTGKRIQSMNLYHMDFVVPIWKNLLLFAAAAVICVLIPPLLYRMLQKGSLTERLSERE